MIATADTITKTSEEEGNQRKLAESLERIRLAESFPVKGDRVTYTEQRQDWIRPVKMRNFAVK